MERPVCAWCEQNISVTRLFSDRQFCSEEHRSKHEQLAVARLMGNARLMEMFEAERVRTLSKASPALAPAVG